jgi:hypothetical protein
MKKTIPASSFLTFLLAICLPFMAVAQQQVTVISRCGGLDTVSIPAIVDNDADGMDDVLEQKLLNRFMPTFIQFDNESCPGPAIDGSGDSNLVVCHIYPIPQQYVASNKLDSVKNKPSALVPKRGLTVGLYWYRPFIMVNAALLYGKDCGALGHTADVEGFSFSLRYVGTDSVAGWMYDTVMQNWIGAKIQTTSHASTPCEHKETKDYKSILTPAGVDTVFASPDKHGNYLTVSGCNTSFICNPGCGGVQAKKNVKAVNIGEPAAPLITDLGTVYPAYSGDDPWGTAKFLASQSGDAGTIKDKMVKALTSDFAVGQKINTAAEICTLYIPCFGPFASTFQHTTCFGGSFTFNGKALQASGIYYDTLSNINGCDSLITLNLTVATPAGSTIQANSCSTTGYDFKGATLFQSGTYKDTLTNLQGCDSIVSLQLTILNPSATNISRTICMGDSFIFNQTALTADGVYVDTLINSFGCDSIVTLGLTTHLPDVEWNYGADTIYATDKPVLLVGATPFGGTFSGPGVSGSVFDPLVAGPGNYIVVYSYTDSLSCINTAAKTIIVLPTGINEVKELNNIILYPNPVKDELHIFFGHAIPLQTEVYLTAMNGARTRLNYKADGDNMKISMGNIASGLYMLQLYHNGIWTNKKIIK